MWSKFYVRTSKQNFTDESQDFDIKYTGEWIECIIWRLPHICNHLSVLTDFPLPYKSICCHACKAALSIHTFTVKCTAVVSIHKPSGWESSALRHNTLCSAHATQPRMLHITQPHCFQEAKGTPTFWKNRFQYHVPPMFELTGTLVSMNKDFVYTGLGTHT